MGPRRPAGSQPVKRWLRTKQIWGPVRSSLPSLEAQARLSPAEQLWRVAEMAERRAAEAPRPSAAAHSAQRLPMVESVRWRNLCRSRSLSLQRRSLIPRNGLPRAGLPCAHPPKMLVSGSYKKRKRRPNRIIEPQTSKVWKSECHESIRMLLHSLSLGRGHGPADHRLRHRETSFQECTTLRPVLQDERTTQCP